VINNTKFATSGI